MRTLPLLLFAAVLCALAAAQQPAAPPSAIRPVATVKQLHDAMITPASDALFNAGAQAPKDDQAWSEVANEALVLAESGNLLMLGSRAKDQGAWMKMSRALVDAAAEAAKAAQDKNLNALMAAGDRIETSCESCHVPYRDNGRQMMK